MGVFVLYAAVPRRARWSVAKMPSMAWPHGSPVAWALSLAHFSHRDTEVQGVCGDAVRTESDRVSVATMRGGRNGFVSRWQWRGVSVSESHAAFPAHAPGSAAVRVRTPSQRVAAPAARCTRTGCLGSRRRLLGTGRGALPDGPTPRPLCECGYGDRVGAFPSSSPIRNT